jgi:hypothetical protein
MKKYNYEMTIVFSNGFNFPFLCSGDTRKQAIAFARKVHGRYVMVRDLKEYINV